MALMEDCAESRPATPRRSRNAKRSSLACAACKRSKRRCDIAEQLLESDGCTNCKSKGELCELRLGEDKRRRRPAYSQGDYGSRIDALERLLSAHSPTSLGHQRSRVLNRSHPSSPQREQQPVTLQQPATVQQPPNPMVADGFLWSPTDIAESRSPADGDAAPPRMPNPVQTPPSRIGCSLAESQNPDIGASAPTDTRRVIFQGNSAPTPSGSATTDTTNAIMGKVIARESGLEDQGNEGSEYFGTTSIHYLSNQAGNEQDNCSQPAQSQKQQIQTVVSIPADLDTSNEPEPIVSHLLDLFWTWQATYLQIFHRESFLTEKRLFDTERPRRRYAFFSPSLLYSIMAIGTMISPDRGVKYQSAVPGGVPGDMYFEKAKRLFDQEMAYPSITTVQTALLIGSRYGAVGQSSLGWIYSGIAIRMAIQIGLHIDCEKAVASKQMSTEIAEGRRLVFWGCYIQDKLWSAYTGRPSSIVDWNITVQLPHAADDLQTSTSSLHDIQAAVHCHILLLATKCSKILTELYSRKHEGDPENLRRAASTIHTEMISWQQELPEGLKWPNREEMPTSPHVLVMHMQFYFTLLLLHRPFINLDDAVVTINHLGEGQPSATSICTLAATNITKLARDYSLFYSIKQIASPAIHFIFIAATIHIINYQISPSETHKYLFQGCLASLAEIGEGYPMSLKAVITLQDLARRLQAHASRSDRQSSLKGNAAPPVQSLKCAPSKSTTCNDPQPTSGTWVNRTSFDHEGTQNLADPSAGAIQPSAPLISEPANFDWSTYNSPITLPPNLNIFDLDVFDFSGGLATEFSSQIGCVPDSTSMGTNIGGIEYPWPDTSAGTNDDAITSATLFDNYYGTTFGLA